MAEMAEMALTRNKTFITLCSFIKISTVDLHDQNIVKICEDRATEFAMFLGVIKTYYCVIFFTTIQLGLLAGSCQLQCLGRSYVSVNDHVIIVSGSVRVL